MSRATRSRFPYSFGDRFALRTPLLPLEAAFDTHGGDVAAQRAHLAAVIARPDVSEALFLASPGLHRQIDVWLADPHSERGSSIERTLVRYVSRMATRSTPFGLFAGMSVGRVARAGEAERLVVSSGHRRRTRVDNDVLFDLAARLARTEEARRTLLFHPSTSLVRVAGQLRYARASQGEKRAIAYHLVSVDDTPYLSSTLERARRGEHLEDLAAALVADDADLELDEAREYVTELADAQILVPALGVTVTGPDPIEGMIAQLTAAGLDEPARALDAVREDLAALDAAGVGAPTGRYGSAIARLTSLTGAQRPLDPDRLFQVDLVPATHAVLGADVVREVRRALQAMAPICGRSEDPALAEFRREFEERWEGREVPLAMVLDEEAGIGFGRSRTPGAEGAPLLAGLPFPTSRGDDRAAWGRREDWLLVRLQRAAAERATEWVLDDDDLARLRVPEGSEARLPDAMSTMIRVGRTGDGLQILMQGTGGPSGVRLLGRFCQVDPAMTELVREHVDAEAALRPDAVLAEIVHLPDGRIGNLLCRPILRSYEIPYLGIGGGPEDQRLPIDDLVVGIREGRVFLRSVRLGREVLPRLTSAHNYRTGLGVYRFLCALQEQGADGLGFSWGPLATADWLPRVRLGAVVLRRAEWALYAPEIAALAAAAREGRAVTAASVLRAHRRIPRYVVLADSDRELWADLEHELLVRAFVDEIRSRASVRLLEAFPAPDAAVVVGPEGKHFSEIVLTLLRTPDRGLAPRALPTRAYASTAVPRRFPPGSSWLYAKLYGGVSSADRTLREIVAPLCRHAMDGGIATRWFFLRFADPNPHLRLRLEGDQVALWTLVPALHHLAAPLMSDGALWRIALDTYDREVERYGGASGISLCEDVFWRDSEATLAILGSIEGDEGAETRWWMALRSVDELLDALGFAAEQRVRLYREGRDHLFAEHRLDAAFRKAVGARYKDHRPWLDELFREGGEHRERTRVAVEALGRRNRALVDVGARLRDLESSAELSTPLARVALSLTHMTCNRLFHASQRAQEMLIYEYLRRHHLHRATLG